VDELSQKGELDDLFERHEGGAGRFPRHDAALEFVAGSPMLDRDSCTAGGLTRVPAWSCNPDANGRVLR
jgi:hypothetical protein